MPTVEVSNWGDAIFLSLSNALNSFLAAIPQIIGALVIIVIGWIIAGILARIVTGLLRRAGADRLFAEHGGDVYGEQSRKVQPSVVAGELVKWLVRIVFLVAAANVLGMPQVSSCSTRFCSGSRTSSSRRSSCWSPRSLRASSAGRSRSVPARWASPTGGCSAGSPRSRSWPSR